MIGIYIQQVQSTWAVWRQSRSVWIQTDAPVNDTRERKQPDDGCICNATSRNVGRQALLFTPPIIPLLVPTQATATDEEARVRIVSKPLAYLQSVQILQDTRTDFPTDQQ